MVSFYMLDRGQALDQQMFFLALALRAGMFAWSTGANFGHYIKSGEHRTLRALGNLEFYQYEEFANQHPEPTLGEEKTPPWVKRLDQELRHLRKRFWQQPHALVWYWFALISTGGAAVGLFAAWYWFRLLA